MARQGNVYLNSDFCKACGICAAFCPKGVLAWQPDQLPQVILPEACNACLLCFYRCPDFAIEVGVR